MVITIGFLSQMVTEEKFTLLFRTHFTIGGGELEVNVKVRRNGQLGYFRIPA